jgi:chromate reductase
MAEYPARAREMKDLVEAADGVLFVTPEYNRSIPGVLKNTIDWLSRPWGTNSFAGKPVGIVGVSPTPVGTATAQAHLRTIAAFLDMKQMGQPEIYVVATPETFDADGTLADERWGKNLAAYMEKFAAWVKDEK